MIGTSSQTLEEAFKTAVRVRRAEKRALTMLADVERIAIVRAQAHVGARGLGQKRRQRVEILADRAFADQNPHPLLQLLPRLFGGCRLMLCPNSGSAISIQIPPRQQRTICSRSPTRLRSAET